MKPFLFCIAAGLMLVGLVPAASAQLLDPASLAQADTNGDGLLTEAEFLKHRSSYFAVMDKDASGGASEAEFNESFSARSKRMAARAFREMDTTGDGLISASEWDAYPPKAFQHADRNGDGQLDQSEMSRLNARR